MLSTRQSCHACLCCRLIIFQKGWDEEEEEVEEGEGEEEEEGGMVGEVKE